MPPQLSVLVPCYNESASLPELVARLLATLESLGIEGEIILVDDGSRDDSLAVMRRLEAQHAAVRCLHHDRNQGLFAAWLTALAAAAGTHVCMIDADLQYQPEDVARLWEHLAWSHADVAQGARFNVHEPRGIRFWLSRGMGSLLNLAFGMRLADNKSGFFVTRREVAADILNFDRRRYYYPQTFVMVAAHAKGYSIGEIRTVFASRTQGESFIPRLPIRVTLRCLYDVARGLGEFRGRARITCLARRIEQSPPAAPRPPRPITPPLARYLRAMPLHHWMIGRQAGDYFAQLDATQWWSPAQIRQLQNERLQLLVQHAYQHTPFYRRRFDQAGIRPEQVVSIEDLAALPPLTKQDIRGHVHFDLLADNVRHGDLYPIRTSGSTGEPLLCYVDRPQLEMRWAATLRGQQWTGYRFGDRTVRLWHQTIGMTSSQIFKEKLDAWWCRRLFIPAWEMSAQNLEAVVARMLAHRPILIDGYAESLHLLAEYLQEHPVGWSPLRALMSSAQTLSASSRRIMEQTFGCPVYDKYGAREFSGIAYQCEVRRGYHVVGESYLVEVVKDGRPARPGEIGEVLVTDLNNRCMPLLRYKLGDLARVADQPDCPCGRGLPLLGEIMGRTRSIIIGADNQFLPGSFFAHYLKEYDYAIRQFQVVQERLGEIELRIVRGGRFSPAVLDEILATLRKHLGSQMRIQVSYPEQIPLVRTGKAQHSISRLEFDFQSGGLRPIDVAPGDGQPHDLELTRDQLRSN